MEFKISYKKSNADFLENKIRADRAAEILGSDWSEIIQNSISTIKDKFLAKPLIYKSKYKRTEAGAITLGWKFELLNKKSGELSGELKLTQHQLSDVYAGTNLSKDKRNALINNNIVQDSGVANFILFSKTDTYSSTQDVINDLVDIDQYINNHPKIYFACKALNYRSLVNKYDGDRPLAVYVNWEVINNKLSGTLCFDTPLQQGGNAVNHRLHIALDKINATNTIQLNSNNVHNPEIIYGNEQ